MAIWYSNYELSAIQFMNNVNMFKHLGIELTEFGEDFLKGTMPVDERTRQPFGVLHGGATCVLAESLGSIAANLVINPATHYAVGLDINANHLRPVKEGFVIGIAKPIHIGRSTQVWEIKIEDENGKNVAISRLTMAVLERK